MTAETKKMGRPSTYGEVLVDELLFRIASGRSIRDVCEDEDMPNRRTLWDWQQRHPEFDRRLARARADSVDGDLDEMRGLSSRVLKEKGLDPQRVRVALDALDKAARLRRPRQIELSGRDGGPIQTQDLSRLTHEQLQSIEAILAANTNAGGGEGGDPA